MLISNPLFAVSEQESELALVRNTVENLLNAMVEQGLITREAAEALIADAEQKAAAEIAEIEAEQEVQPGDVRVTYVPQTVVDKISAEVTRDVSDEVTTQVIARAREDGWGVPAALPEWLREGRFFGDVRVRAQPVSFGSNNGALDYQNFQNINNNGGVAGLSATDRYFNTTEDDTNYNLRLRFGARFKPWDIATLGFRMATDGGNPVSRNVDLGNSGGAGFELALDEAYINLHTTGDRLKHHWNLWAGRVPNVWQSSSLVFDEDLRLDGLVVGYDQLARIGDGGARGLFARVGAYPLQNTDARSEQFGVKDKWLYAAQAGYEFGFRKLDAKLAVAAAYYHFDNIAGVLDETTPVDPNTPSGFTDDSIPDFVRKGNSLFNVRNVDASSGRQIFGLASDFELVNINARFTKALRPNFDIQIWADWVENIGYDRDEIFIRTGRLIDEENTGYRLEAQLGAPKMLRFKDWNTFIGYSLVERDAVVDGFSESDFHGGGTDHSGYYLGGSFALAPNTWLRGRYLSFDEEDGPTLGIDILQIDLNAKF